MGISLKILAMTTMKYFFVAEKKKQQLRTIRYSLERDKDIIKVGL